MLEGVVMVNGLFEERKGRRGRGIVVCDKMEREKIIRQRFGSSLYFRHRRLRYTI